MAAKRITAAEKKSYQAYVADMEAHNATCQQKNKIKVRTQATWLKHYRAAQARQEAAA